MKKERIDIGYFTASDSKSSMTTFKERSNDAIKIGVRLCLISLTKKNLVAILEGENIQVRVWKNNSFLEEISIPVPKVIYDRSLIAKSSSISDLFVEAMLYSGCQFINSPEVRSMARDKWAQFKFFFIRGIKIPYTVKYLPKELSHFLRKNIIFIKPRSGSEGKRQIIIRRVIDKEKKTPIFSVTSTFGKKNQVMLYGVKEVKDYLKKFPLSSDSYIIQEGIKIDKIEEEVRGKKRSRSFDFRVIVQRTSIGNPVVTIAFIRVGPSLSDQANISQGGHPQDIESVFDDHKQVVSDLKADSVRIFNLLAEEYDVSEMAFDFVSSEGENYFIEMNSRPGTKGPRTLREWVPSDDMYARKGVILFDEEYSNQRRQRWGARFFAFRILPFYYGRTLFNNLKKERDSVAKP